MRFINCCRDCSCWAIFTFSMLILLIALIMAVDDLTLVAEGHQAISAIETTSEVELACHEVCRSWYFEERGTKCCDRMLNEICMEKDVCRAEFISAQNAYVENLKNDAESELIIATACACIAIGIIYFQMRKGQGASASDLQLRIERTVMRVLQKSREDQSGRKQGLDSDVVGRAQSHLESTFATFELSHPNQTVNPEALSKSVRKAVNNMAA